MNTHQTILIETAPIRITPNGIHSGMDITIQNTSETNNVYVGKTENLSSSNFGYIIYPRSAFAIELPPLDAIYLVSENEGAAVGILPFGLED